MFVALEGSLRVFGGAILGLPGTTGVCGPGRLLVELFCASGDLGLCGLVWPGARLGGCPLLGILFLRLKCSDGTDGSTVTSSGWSPWGTLKSTSSKSSPE